MTAAAGGFMAAIWDDDSIPADVRTAVLLRDCRQCLRCGVLVIGGEFGVIRHRLEDGEPVAENLLTACDHCRRRIGLRLDQGDHRSGFWLWPGQDPAAVPVWRHGDPGLRWLLRDGGTSSRAPGEGGGS